MNDLVSRMEVGSRKETRRKILRSALDCFETKGIEACSIEDIRLLSGSSVGSIYHHFKNKEGLVSHLYAMALIDQSAGMTAALQQAASVEQSVKNLVILYMAWVESNPKEARLLFRGRSLAVSGDVTGALQSHNQARFSDLMGWVRKGVENGLLRKYPSPLYPSILIGQAENYCRSWLSGRVKQSPSGAADAIADATWRAVRPE